MKKLILATAILASQAYGFTGSEGGGALNCAAFAQEYASAIVKVSGVQPDIQDVRLTSQDGTRRYYEVTVNPYLGFPKYVVTLAGNECEFVSVRTK